jgi:hypothetical protein
LNARKKKNDAGELTGKQWHPIFSTPRARSNESYYESVRDAVRNMMEHGVAEDSPVAEGSLDQQDLLDTFLGDHEGSIPSWEARIVRYFFSEYEEPGCAPKSWAWLDDREYSSGRSRPLPRALDLQDLSKALKQEASRIDTPIEYLFSNCRSVLDIRGFQMLIVD